MGGFNDETYPREASRSLLLQSEEASVSLTWREQIKDAVKGIFHAFSKSMEEEVEAGKVPSQDQLKCFLFQYPAE